MARTQRQLRDAQKEIADIYIMCPCMSMPTDSKCVRGFLGTGYIGARGLGLGDWGLGSQEDGMCRRETHMQTACGGIYVSLGVVVVEMSSGC